MKYTYKFHHILSIKEHEKDSTLTEYNSAVQRFEEVGNKLYELLKQKEDSQAKQITKISSGLSIQDIRHHQQLISHIDKSINIYQNLVAEARLQMQMKEKKLIEANIEMKKYEKMKEKDYENFLLTNKAIENNLMNEISMQQFLKAQVNG
ncbi:flagellar export protein FliJ [Cytobacillus sp. Hm23]|uniref:flagellar export protein FliJ n=1 Tax=Cytobacillus sp. IB215665 TaxID=3097357 RepID=UPI002A13D50D|nr:flagellar export protein FliJ [Cytobacillus sp. IB215665]MDX8365065.1 flagellar export protein FliJ [Cytobacillus sp. IB215665]